MKISAAGLSRFRLITVLAFVVACAAFFVYLQVQAGAKVPVVAPQGDYEVSAVIDDVDNLVAYSDVTIAGVLVGKVDDITRAGSGVRVRLRLDQAAPLHDGVTVQVSEKSLAGQSNITIVDGQGAPVPSGATLPASAVKPSVQLRDVLASLDPATRDALSGSIRSLGTATNGTKDGLNQTVQGLGALGERGYTALDALSAQSQDLTKLASELSTALYALNTGHDDLAKLVGSTDKLASATAGQRQALSDTVRSLPGVLSSAQTATGKITAFSGSLAPVVRDLNAAAPDLSTALRQLPQTTSDLRGLLPSLDTALGSAPATLDRLPAGLGTDAQALIPRLRGSLADLNPMLRYLAPYGKDIGSFVANFHAAFAHKAADGKSVLRLYPVFDGQTVKADPVNSLTNGVLTGANGYPQPGGLSDLRPFTGDYPRLYPDQP